MKDDGLICLFSLHMCIPDVLVSFCMCIYVNNLLTKRVVLVKCYDVRYIRVLLCRLCNKVLKSPCAREKSLGDELKQGRLWVRYGTLPRDLSSNPL